MHLVICPNLLFNLIEGKRVFFAILFAIAWPPLNLFQKIASQSEVRLKNSSLTIKIPHDDNGKAIAARNNA